MKPEPLKQPLRKVGENEEIETIREWQEKSGGNTNSVIHPDLISLVDFVRKKELGREKSAVEWLNEKDNEVLKNLVEYLSNKISIGAMVKVVVKIGKLQTNKDKAFFEDVTKK